MQAVKNKINSLQLVSISILFLLNGCISTEKKDETTTNTPSNSQIEKVIIENTPPKIIAKRVVPIKAPIQKTIALSKVSTKVKKQIKKTEIKKTRVNEPAITLPLPEVILASLKQLPLTLSNGWVVSLKTLPLATAEACVLYNEKHDVFDGYKNNNIKLYLTFSQLLIHSDSNFDLSYPQSGVYIEDHVNNRPLPHRHCLSMNYRFPLLKI
jgi:hypothetical protein